MADATADDAIALLKEDHKKVKALLKRFDEMDEPSRADKRALAERILRELMVHETIEEQVFYPAFKEAAKRAQDEEASDLVAESKEEHHVVDVLMEELQAVDVEAEDFDAKMSVLKENVEHHIEEEEDEMFPDARELLGAAKLRELGEVMAELQRSLLAEKPPKRHVAH